MVYGELLQKAVEAYKYMLEKKEPVTTTEIRVVFKLETGQARYLLKRLEKAGVVEKVKLSNRRCLWKVKKVVDLETLKQLLSSR